MKLMIFYDVSALAMKFYDFKLVRKVKIIFLLVSFKNQCIQNKCFTSTMEENKKRKVSLQTVYFL